jgi:alkyldihydroxyacetonephosphate synthase
MEANQQNRRCEMRRWNGWGDDTILYPLPSSAAAYLVELVGPGIAPTDASLEQVLDSLPDSRIPHHPLIAEERLARLKHARGQSLPDWVALRSGRIRTFPDGVAYPLSIEDVQSLLQYASKNGVRLIPYGGGTSVVGHINPLPGAAPVVTINMTHMNRLRHFDPESLLATFEAGISGPDLEAQLRARGCTLGHFPQSFELSTLGGWIATRSSGQQSLGYGRIEKLFAGGQVESPAGSLRLPPFPASAAGPDLREMVLGSEGRLGIITEATVRVTQLPETEAFHGIFFPDFHNGQMAVQQMLQARLPMVMLRLSTAEETTTTLALAGHENLLGIMEGLLSVRGLGEEKCLLLVGFAGKSGLVGSYRKEVLGIARKFGGIHAGKTFGQQWHKNRFRTPYLRNTLWERGYAIDTVETATEWSNVPRMVSNVDGALRTALAESNEIVHVFTHLSHLYPYGSSIYTTYLFRISADVDETLERWQKLKNAASNAIVKCSGTISHQHGVGTDHKPYLLAEKGPLGISAIEDLFKRFDPSGLMNPEKLL